MRLIVNDVDTLIEGNYPKEILDPITSYRKDGYWFAPSFKKGLWDGFVRFIKKVRGSNSYHVPSGFVSRMCAALDNFGIVFDLIDNRTTKPVTPNYELNDVELRPYQMAMVDQACFDGRGVLKAATGAGKTVVGAAIIKSVGGKSIWLTHRLTLLYQTKKNLERYLGHEVGIIGDGKVDIKEVTVVMVQSATSSNILGNESVARLLREAKVVIGDEVHHLESEQWFDLFEKIKAPYRFGLTATPDTTGPGLALCAMTGEIIADIPVQLLIDTGILVRPFIWIKEVRDPQLDKKLSFQEAYAQGIVENLGRNLDIVEVAKKFAEQKKPTLTLIKRVKHGVALNKLFKENKVKSEYIQGSATNEERDAWVEKLCKGQLDNIIATVDIMGEGVDIPEIRAIINATGMKCGGSPQEGQNGRLTIQILGRGLRKALNKFHLDYVDFSDRTHKFLQQASLSRMQTLDSEGYSDFMDYWSNYS